MESAGYLHGGAAQPGGGVGEVQQQRDGVAVLALTVALLLVGHPLCGVVALLMTWMRCRLHSQSKIKFNPHPPHFLTGVDGSCANPRIF